MSVAVVGVVLSSAGTDGKVVRTINEGGSVVPSVVDGAVNESVEEPIVEVVKDSI